mmetsp:Transcript_112245/g.358241  ORF Transcript_112245/g.358241 Transcript_112245/m.358241 type:complete len:371 (+) Transcript_112245:2-1114(+)
MLRGRWRACMHAGAACSEVGGRLVRPGRGRLGDPEGVADEAVLADVVGIGVEDRLVPTAAGPDARVHPDDIVFAQVADHATGALTGQVLEDGVEGQRILREIWPDRLEELLCPLRAADPRQGATADALGRRCLACRSEGRRPACRQGLGAADGGLELGYEVCLLCTPHGTATHVLQPPLQLRDGVLGQCLLGVLCDGLNQRLRGAEALQEPHLHRQRLLRQARDRLLPRFRDRSRPLLRGRGEGEQPLLTGRDLRARGGQLAGVGVVLYFPAEDQATPAVCGIGVEVHPHRAPAARAAGLTAGLEALSKRSVPAAAAVGHAASAGQHSGFSHVVKAYGTLDFLLSLLRPRITNTHGAILSNSRVLYGLRT